MGVITPKSGKIYLETKCGNVDIKNWGKHLFSYVPQGNLLFAGTILDNICFFDNNPDRKKAEDALKCADVWEYISSLDNGMDTYIGENGEGLSEGQAQRIAIARAIYNDAKIIILDEAQNTSVQQIKMFLTRMGLGSKMIITGDMTQIDLPPQQKSGLKDAMEVLKDIKGIGFVHFNQKDIVRHKLVQRIVDAYNKH